MERIANTSMKILLIRLSSFGDVVFTLPLAKALKSMGPGAAVAWAIEDPLAPLVAGAPYVDAVLLAQTRRWRRAPLSRDTRADAARFLAEARAFAPDVVVDAQGLWKSAWATFLVPAARKVGFGPLTATERVNCLATDERVEARGRAHAVDRALALAEHLSGRAGFERVPDVSHLVAREDPEVDAWLAARASRPFALLQPFSSHPGKEWPDASLLAVARRLLASSLPCVVRWGPGERERAAALASASGGAVELAPPAGPAASARLAARAALFVGADTGPTHLAAAAGSPTLALFGPTDPARFGPVGPRAAVLRDPGATYNPPGASVGALPPDEIADKAVALLA